MARAFTWFVRLVMLLFVTQLVAIVAAVVVSSFGTHWLGTWLPEGFTTSWFTSAWSEFDLFDVVVVTLKVAITVVFISLVLGVPAAYALARQNFVGKRIVMTIFVLPLLVPPITYGIPLATLLYSIHLGGTITGVILANLVPSVAFVILTMMPFVEQIDPKVEAAARVCGAGTWSLFRRILVPMLVPGLLAAAVLVLVRTVGMFELTFLTSGPDSQTLIVALYYAVFAPGVRALQSIDAIAVIYMVMTLTLLMIALRFVNPTQLVARVRD